MREKDSSGFALRMTYMLIFIKKAVAVCLAKAISLPLKELLEMRIAGIAEDSIVDGPGLRVSVFTQGCPHGCEGCHNREAQEFEGGQEMSVEEIIAIIKKNELADGVTLTGGEPFCQPEDCAKIARAAKAAGLNIWTYSGYTLEELCELSKENTGIMELLSVTDVLVDGRFILAEKSFDVKWRGSKNQRLIDVPRSLAANKAAEL